MEKVKIQEIADEVGLSNSELLNSAKELGFNVKAADSTISMDDAGLLVDYAISSTLPKNWNKTKSEKTKIVKNDCKKITYNSPKKTKWNGIYVVGKKVKTDSHKAKEVSSTVTKVVPKNKKKTKRSVASDPVKKLINPFENARLTEPTKNIAVMPKKQYTPSERSALKKGFTEITDSNAYNGRYFIKNEKIWIHDIGALKARLGVATDQDVRAHGYDVDTYHEVNTSKGYKKHNNTPKSLRMCDTKDGDGGCHYNLDDMVYMCDGVYIHKDDCWW